MRWIRFSDKNKIVYGIIKGETVSEIDGDPFGAYQRTDRTHPLSTIKYEVPVIPGTFYCVGPNYVTHITEMARERGQQLKLPAKADTGYRANSALIPHNEPVIIPTDARALQYQAELVVVIGTKAKYLSEHDALKCVFGYTIGNDLSERNWQRADRTFWRSKNSDTFKPMGPWIETELDLDAAQTIVRVNKIELSRFKTNEMLFSIAHFISTITRYITLYPGDVIWMGTNGVSPDISAGDVVEIEITGIGTLRNPFAAEDASLYER